MPYVPPHKRAGSTAEAAEPPLATFCRVNLHGLSQRSEPYRNDGRSIWPIVSKHRSGAGMFIILRSASKCIKANVIVPVETKQQNRAEPLMVQFRPAGLSESYAHLAGKKLYMLAPFDEESDNGAASAEFALLPDRALPMSTAERVMPMLLQALDNVRTAEIGADPNAETRVKIAVRLGQVLVYSPIPGHRLEYLNSVPAEAVERQLRNERALPERLWKSLETNLPVALFEEVDKVAQADAYVRGNATEKYVLQVKDSRRPDTVIRVDCRLIGNDGASNEGQTKLTIAKVKLDPVRYMVVDIIPLGKKAHFRLVLWTETRFLKLEDEEREGLEALVHSAIIDPSVKGGLRWPLQAAGTSNDARKERFTVQSIRHASGGYNYQSVERKWKLRHVNGAELDSATGRLTREVELFPVKWRDSMQLLREERRRAQGLLLGTSPEANPGPSSEGGALLPAGENGQESATSPVWKPEDMVAELPGLLQWLSKNLP